MREHEIARTELNETESSKSASLMSREAILPPPRPRHLGTYKVIPPEKPFDEQHRTIAFLDDFTKDGFGPSIGKTRISHGEISASAAEQNGFNVLRLQRNYKAIRYELSSDFSLPLKAIHEDILAGRLKMRAGDMLNISSGQPFLGIMGQPSFAELNELLNLSGDKVLSAKNINSVHEHSVIFTAIKKKLMDPELDPRVSHRLEDALKANDYVRKIQGLGIQVVIAAGNNGAERFSLDFLSARKRLAATDSEGRLTDFSAIGNDSGQGRYRVMFRGTDFLTPESVSSNAGDYWLEGTTIHYKADPMETSEPISAKGFIASPYEDKIVNRPILQASHFSKVLFEAPLKIEHVKSIESNSTKAPIATKYVFLEHLNGTSYANIDWYRKHLSVKR